MHENANRLFVAELRQNDTPEKFTRVVVHGRVHSAAHGEWFVVITDILPGGELSSYYGDGFHGHTRIVASTEHLTIGAEAVHTHKMPMVNHEGVATPHPGWVTVGETVASPRAKRHVVRYRFAGTDSTDVGCYLADGAETFGAMDTAWYMDQKNTCRSCRNRLTAFIDTL